VPAEVASTHKGKEPGILRLEFPKARNHNDDKLQEITWEEFFQKFDENDLELILQDRTAEGEQSNFNKFVHPEHEEHSKSKKKAAK
jgi:anaerobic selenocysteine-containing dehydrogenase